MAKRAYAAEDKAARRSAILSAAADLFSETRELPSIAEVAAQAGLAKGTVYLYFRTKGAILADILISGWSAALEEIDATFSSTQVGRAEKISGFLSEFARYLTEKPMLLQLDAVVHSLLERDLEPGELAAFKQSLHQLLSHSGGVLDDALGLSPGRGYQLLIRTHALTRGLWGYFDTKAGPDLSGFSIELVQALTEYWRGALIETVPVGVSNVLHR